MSESMEWMKECVKAAYDYADRWSSKVDRMPNMQIVAIYRYLKERGTFKRNRGGFIVYSKGKKDTVKTDIYHQMTLEEWERSLKL